MKARHWASLRSKVSSQGKRLCLFYLSQKDCVCLTSAIAFRICFFTVLSSEMLSSVIITVRNWVCLLLQKSWKIFTVMRASVLNSSMMGRVGVLCFTMVGRSEAASRLYLNEKITESRTVLKWLSRVSVVLSIFFPACSRFFKWLQFMWYFIFSFIYW